MKRSLFVAILVSALARCGGGVDDGGPKPGKDASSGGSAATGGSTSTGGAAGSAGDASADEPSTEADVSVDPSIDTGSDVFDASIDVAPDPCAAGSYITIDAPQEITAPGCYRVTQDLSNGDFALYIHDTSEVYLDCDGHSLLSTGTTTGALHIENLQNFSVRNCTIQAELPQFVVYGLELEASKHGVFDHDVLRAADVKQSDDLWVVNGTIQHYYQQTQTTGVTVANNGIVGDPSVTIAATIVFAQGSNNRALYNQIDGKWNGDLSSQLAADDGIVVQEESDDVIQGNVITNTWDCGFETVGVVQNTQVVGNVMSHAGFCCIGAWHWNNWLGNTVSDNTCTDIGSLFILKRLHGFEPSETVLYFKNNLFQNNVQVPGGWELPSLVDFANLPPEIPASAVDLGNDVFTGNSFSYATPILLPPSMFVDGGGNSCPKGTDPAFPLACGKP